MHDGIATATSPFVDTLFLSQHLLPVYLRQRRNVKMSMINVEMKVEGIFKNINNVNFPLPLNVSCREPY